MNIWEGILVGCLTVLIASPFFIGFTHRDHTIFWNPLTAIAAVFAYYFLVGPLISLSQGATFAYGFDLRDVMWKPWLAAAIGLGSIYAGFTLSFSDRNQRGRRKYAETFDAARRAQIRWFCFILFGLGMVGFLYYAYSSGRSLVSILTPVATDSDNLGSDRQGLVGGNYLFLLINAFIPAVCMWYVLNARKPIFMRVLLVGIPVVLVTFFYTTLGFRHRIVILSLALSATVYLLRRKRPNPVSLMLGIAALLFAAGLIVLTRSYNRGLDLAKVSGMSFSDIFMGGFNDTGTFFTMALVMNSIPKYMPYFGFQSLWVAATIPVPRALWPGKPEPDYLWAINELAGTQGQAVPVTGEHYMMAGWFGVILGGLVIGMIYRGFWNFYRANPRNPIVIVIYAMSFGLCFPLVNRGYLAQTLMEYFFGLMPIVVLFWMFRSGMTVRHAAPVTLGGQPPRGAFPGPRSRRPVS